MDASEAILWFNDTPVSGWNGSAWVSNVAAGDLQVYDRFISDRVFGVKKRIFLTPETTKLDMATYPLIKFEDGTIWLAVSDSPDINGHSEGAYQHSFLVLQTNVTIEVIETTTTVRASGAPGDPVRTSILTTWGDLERFGHDRADHQENITFNIFEVTLPGGTAVTPDNLLLIDGDYYDIQEVYPELNTVVVRALRRDGS